MKPILFRTNNCYLYSTNKNQFLLINPILYEIIERKQNGATDNEVLQQLTENNNPNIILNSIFDKNKYYLNKYYFLKKEGYLNTNNVEKKICKRYTANEVEVALTNTVLIIFEVTDKCNLNCKYCTYGKIYNNL